MRNNPWKTELKVARSQRNKLRTISARLKEMTCEWDGLIADGLKNQGCPGGTGNMKNLVVMGRFSL